MKLEWMGKHRAAVEAMIRCGNSYSQGVNLRGLMTDKVDISAAELQVMEYILENEERRENMSQVAARLDISQSSFSKLVSELVRLGLLEKYPQECDHSAHGLCQGSLPAVRSRRPSELAADL